MAEVLCTDSKYEGMYVAFKSYAEREVIAWGEEPRAVMAEARQKGYEEPFITYIPKHEMTSIF